MTTTQQAATTKTAQAEIRSWKVKRIMEVLGVSVARAYVLRKHGAITAAQAVKVCDAAGIESCATLRAYGPDATEPS